MAVNRSLVEESATGTVVLEGQSLVVSGQFDNDNITGAREEGERAIRTCDGSVMIDLASLQTTSSAVLSLLLCWMRAGRREGVVPEFQNMPSRLFDMARVSGLDTFLPLASPADNSQAAAAD